MYSWVRYSVSVYLGLLMAGSIVAPPAQSVGSSVQPAPATYLLPKQQADASQFVLDSPSASDAAARPALKLTEHCDCP